jgi:hypothetical protein
VEKMSSTTIKVVIDGKGTVSGLTPVQNGLKNIATQAERTQQSVSKAVKFDFTASIPQLKGMQDRISGLSAAFSTFKTLSVGGLVGAAVIKGISSTIDKAVELENALIGVNSVAKAFGADTDAVKKAILDFTKDGLVSATDATLAFKQILSTGTELPKAIELMTSLKDVAAFNRQSFYSLGEAIIATTEGIKNGNSVKADAVGVTKNLSVLEAEYARSIGKTVGQLTDQEKMIARVTGFIRESAFAQGDAAKAADTYAGKISALSTAWDRLLARIGSTFTQSTLFNGAISITTKFLDYINNATREFTVDEKLKEAKRQLEGLNKQTGVAFEGNRNVRKNLEEYIKKLNEQKKIEDLRLAQGQYEAKVTRERINKEKELATEKEKQDKAEQARKKELNKIIEKYQDAGLSPLKKLEQQRDRELKIAGDNAQARLLIEKNFQEEKSKLEKATEDKQLARARKNAEIQAKLFEALVNAASDPFSAIETPEDVKAKGKEKQFKERVLLGRAAGVANLITEGAGGAQKLVAGIAGAAINTVILGLGDALQPLLNAFAQGPEAVRQMVKDFTGALPDVIEGFITAIPVFIEELANQLPVIVERLAEKAPAIITKLVEKAPAVAFALMTAMPKVALKFGQELIKNIPKVVGELARAVYDALKKVLEGLTGTGKNGFLSNPLGSIPGSKGGGIGGIAADVIGFGIGGPIFGDKISGGIKKFFGFAEGGEPMMARGGAPFQDSIPAKLMSGELVVDRRTTSKLKKSLDEGFGNAEMMAVLSEIKNLLSQPMMVTADAKVKDEAFANIMLRLDRNNKRIRA